jgi:hypothetical protein
VTGISEVADMTLSFQIELTRKYGLAVCGNEDIRSASNQRCLSELIRQLIYTGE